MRLFLLIFLTSLAGVSVALAQTPTGTSNHITIQTIGVSTSALKQEAVTKPTWKELSTSEQSALRPLAANWDTMGIGQKRKWLSVAKDFAQLPVAQQTKIHARMTEWTAMSPKQRAEARLNFAHNRELTDGLTPEQRKVQWQAYQQLSPEEKRKLADSAPKASLAGAAPAIKPQPVLKKEPAPEFGTAKVLAKAKASPSAPGSGKKIAVAPHVTSQGSILPGNNNEQADKP